MTRVRRRSTRSRMDRLTSGQWFELLLNRHGPWKHFRVDADAREAWSGHRDELLEGLNDPPWTGHVRFPAGLERFEAPSDLMDAAYRLADAEGLEYRAVETAAHAIWLVGADLLDPAWIDAALSHDEPATDELLAFGQRSVGTGPYLAEALRALLATDGPWKAAGQE